MKYKNKIIGYVLLALMSIGFIGVVLLKLNQADTSEIVFSNESDHMGELQAGDEIIQELPVSKDGLKKIEIFMATFINGSNKGQLTMYVEDSKGNEVANRVVDISTIQDNSYEYVDIDSPLQEGEVVKLRIVIDEIEDGTTLACMTSKSDYKDYQMMYNGEAMNVDLATKMDYGNIHGYTLFAVMMIVIITVIIGITMFTLFDKEMKPQRIFLITAIGLGTLYMLMLPVRSVPDEDAHIVTAYDLSNKIMGTSDLSESGRIYMRYCDANAQYRARAYNENIDSLYGNFFDFPSYTEKEMVESVYERGVLDTAKEAYILPAIGITIGRVLGFNGEITLLLGRLLNFILYVSVTYFCIRKIPFGKVPMLLVSMLPMVVQQVASYSYDSLVITMTMAFVCFLCMFMEKDYELRKGDIVLIAIVSIILSRLKGSAYMPLVFLLLIPAIRYRKDITKRKLMYALLSILAIVTAVKAGTMLINTLTATGSSGDNDGMYYLGYLFENKKNTILLIFNTIWGVFDFYIFSTIGYSLSHFTINTPFYVSIVYIMILFLGTISIQGEKKYFTGYEKGLCVLMSLASAGGIALALLFSWTAITTTHIDGVQGRYFLPILILLLVVFRNHLLQLKRDISKYLVVAALFLQYFTVYSVIMFYIR